jgi:hypothetical protein
MCDPVSASIAVAATSAAASLGGSYMNAQAQTRAANSIAEQNRVTALAQNQGFTDRMRAAIAQTGSQRDVMDQTMVDRNAAFTQMREGQTAAMKQQQDIIAAENAKAEELRAQGDTAGQQMLTSTSGDALSGSQDASRAQAAALLSSATAPPIVGPSGTDPNAGGSSSGDSATKQAIARRLAEATTNIRTYGGKVADVTSYAQPGQTVSDAIAANKFGIMPAQAAERLLTAGSPTRLAPATIAYQNATGTGAATDALISSRGQSGLDAASLSYGNATDISNLTQQDADTIAANKNRQAQEDAAAQQSLAGIVSGVGNLGLKGVGYYGKTPDFLKIA